MVARAPLFSRRLRRRIVVSATVASLAVAPSVIAAPGDLTPYPVPPGTPHGVAVAADGHVWFTLRAAGVIGELDPLDGSVEETQLDAASEPTAITVGTDGSVWFTLQSGNAIGRLVPAGDLVVYALPNDGSAPAGIAAAADGSVWFTERLGNRIGRITHTGTIAEWSTTISGPASIAIAPDGIVWFAGQDASKLGRFDPLSEAFTSYDLPAASAPTGVAVDETGDPWVTLTNGSAAVRFDIDTLTMTTVELTPGGRPAGIALGPDGGIWLAETDTGSLIRVDPETLETTRILLGPTAPQSVAADPAGSVWVTESSANRLTSVEAGASQPSDTTPPTIDLRAPSAGSWTAAGSPLVADYGCADEGGSGLATCAGPVASGTAVDGSVLGAHAFDVTATDGAGNATSASASYLAFGSVGGTATGGSARPGAGLTLSLGMELEPKSDPGIVATSAAVDCATGKAVDAPEPAELRDRVSNGGSLELRWLTSRTWGGTCRALTVAFTADGWSGALATFGTVAFAGGPEAKAKR